MRKCKSRSKPDIVLNARACTVIAHHQEAGSPPVIYFTRPIVSLVKFRSRSAASARSLYSNNLLSIHPNNPPQAIVDGVWTNRRFATLHLRERSC
jgi:hypothetical protein